MLDDAGGERVRNHAFFDVGYVPMDDLHDEFCTLMQALADTRDGDYGSRLLDIHTHLLRHCADEERWMRESAFPDYEGHRREHDTLLEVVSEVRRRCDAGDVEIVARLADELPAWFEVHGNTMDAALAFHLKLHTQAQREADRDPLLAA